MDYIKREVYKRLSTISTSSADPMASLAHVMYDVVHSFLKRIVSMDWTHDFKSGGKMVLLGGIQINVDHKDWPDYFLPLCLDLYEVNPHAHGSPKISDLLPQLNQNLVQKMPGFQPYLKSSTSS